MRVLIIEDSAITSRLIQTCLDSLATEVEVKHDGRKGLEAIDTFMPELVILDLGLPSLDGWAVLTKIRNNQRTANLPVVVVTGHGHEAVRTRAEMAGADGFVAKPFRPLELQAATLRAVQKRKAMRGH